MVEPCQRWTADLLKEHLDVVAGERRRVDEIQQRVIEDRMGEADRRLVQIQTNWGERFNAADRVHAAKSESLGKSIDELKRIVYVGLGLVLAAQFVIPLLHR